MTESKDSPQGGIDLFARITSILGLLVAVAAIAVPYLQSQAEKQEQLSIVARPEEGDAIIRLSSDESTAVQNKSLLDKQP